jgi:hypothetical protein
VMGAGCVEVAPAAVPLPRPSPAPLPRGGGIAPSRSARHAALSLAAEAAARWADDKDSASAKSRIA